MSILLTIEMKALKPKVQNSSVSRAKDLFGSFSGSILVWV